jgi:hypothetical protein
MMDGLLAGATIGDVVKIGIREDAAASRAPAMPAGRSATGFPRSCRLALQ